MQKAKKKKKGSGIWELAKNLRPNQAAWKNM